MRRVKDWKRFVAKVVNDEEKQILEYLQERDSAGTYIIFLESTISLGLDVMALFAEHHSVRQLVMTRRKGELPGIFICFAAQLIEGIAFLHRQLVAHLDIKPDNLVYTDSYRIQIIDFDCAIRLRDENDKIDIELGTPDYAAPETRRRDVDERVIPYNPLLADRYSCGVTISDFLYFDRLWGQVDCLKNFADRLRAEDPCLRPSLFGWPEKDEVARTVAAFMPLLLRPYDTRVGLSGGSSFPLSHHCQLEQQRPL